MVGMGGDNAPKRVFQVELVFLEVGGEPVEQVRVPRLGLHGVEGMDDATAHELSPKPVNDRSRNATVFGMDEKFSELFEAFLLRSAGVDVSNLGKEEGGDSFFTGWFVAAVEFEGFFGVNGGEAVGIRESPAVDEAVVTGGTLHVDAEQ